MNRLFLALCCLTLAFVACDRDNKPDIHWGTSGPNQPSQPVPTPDPAPQPTPGKMSAADRRAAARIEMPQLTGAAAERFLVHRVAPAHTGADSILNYAVDYDVTLFHSRWVAFRFDVETRPKKVGRKPYSQKPQYPADPLLARAEALPSNLSFNGYDHGHLVASADRLFSREANDQTFYMSNMSPQVGHFNQKYWTALEGLVQDLGRNSAFADTLYVVKGGTTDRNVGVLKYVANGRVPVPAHYFMALLKVKNGVYSGIAFWLENKNYGKTGTTADMRKHAISIAQLEHNTGINFFHNLPDAVEQRVEKDFTLSAWKL